MHCPVQPCGFLSEEQTMMLINMTSDSVVQVKTPPPPPAVKAALKA